MHSWGDGFQYFGEVGAAADEIGDFCRRYGRIRVTQTKEKWGTARVYCHFGWLSLHGLLFPGYVYKRPGFPQWLWSIDIWYISRVLILFSRPISLYQTFIYRLAYKRALKKYQMISREILGGASYPELLVGLTAADNSH